MPPMSSIIPLPGIGGLESVVKGLISQLKDEVDYHNNGAALMEQLESISLWAGNMNNLTEFTSELQETQRQLRAVNKSKSRQRKLMIWDELSMRLNQKMLSATLKLVAQLPKTLYEQAAGTSRQHQRQLQIVQSYQIINEAKVHSRAWPKHLERHPTLNLKPVKITLRSGQFGKTAVSYLTFDEDSEDTTHAAKEQIKCIRQLNHVNVAKFVGVTEGYNGMNDVVVATGDGIDFYDFLSRTHSGAVWAECIRGFEAFAELVPTKRVEAERITVAHNGHDYRHKLDHLKVDSAVELLIRIYRENYKPLGPTCLRSFVDALVKLGPGFTELQLMKIAADCEILPTLNETGLRYGWCPLHQCPPKVGEFGRASYHNGKLVGWEPLGRSRHVQVTDLDTRPWCVSMKWPKWLAPDGIEWHTIKKTPDDGAWQKQLKIQGWRHGFILDIKTFKMDEGWNGRYEEELKQLMRTTPGSYPGGQIEEVAD
ncbi:hypothetical protein BDV93DRAFT_509057 [Ceratobasidium sp. AG-I]|nr:hypothetical protein BDV93DRAFT_509057 [Ceratobasidium sp. AG-I]